MSSSLDVFCSFLFKEIDILNEQTHQRIGDEEDFVDLLGDRSFYMSSEQHPCDVVEGILQDVVEMLQGKLSFGYPTY